jgi:Transposase, Mutator family
MTKGEGKAEVIDLKGLLARDEDFVRAVVEALVQAALEAVMTEAIGAAKGERSETRLSYRSGYYSRSLITRVGTLELRVPQDRMGRFSTELFERYQRSEKALVGTLAEMYVQGVSTHKVKAVTEALWGTASRRRRSANKSLDEGLHAFAERRLTESYPYLILDARYEKVREAGSSSARQCWWRWRLMRTAVVRSWRSSSPIGRAGRAGAISCRGSRGAASPASSSSSRTTRRGSRRRSARFYRRQHGSAATWIFCAMRSITCRARSMTTACRSCAGQSPSWSCSAVREYGQKVLLAARIWDASGRPLSNQRAFQPR